LTTEKKSPSLIRGTAVVSSLNLLSRILGFVRDVVVAHLFGTGDLNDAFVAAFRIPNLLRSLLAEGAFTSAFIPVFSGELKHGEKHARETFRSVFGLLLLTSVTLTVFGIVYAAPIVKLLTPGFGVDDYKSLVCVRLTALMFPYIIFVSLISLFNGALNAKHSYGAAGWAQVVMNAVMIAGALVAERYGSEDALFIVGFTVLVGGVVQVLYQIPALRREGLLLLPSFKIWTPATRRMLILIAPAVLSAAVYQVAIALNLMLASLLASGSVSAIYFSDRVSQLPVGIFTISLASVLLPALSHDAAHEDSDSFGRNLVNALRYTSVFMLPLSVALFYYAEPVVHILFERGEFTSTSRIMTATAIQATCIGLWGISCSSMAARAFIARKDTKTPTIIGILSLVVGFFLSLLFMGKPMQINGGAFSDLVIVLQGFLGRTIGLLNFGHVGLLLSSSVAATLAFFVYLVLLCRARLGIVWEPLIRSTLQTLAACIVMTGAFLAVGAVITNQIGQLGVGAVVGSLAFILTLKIQKNRELYETFSLVARLVTRSEGRT